MMQSNDQEEKKQWLSTHPTYTTRVQQLNNLIPKVINSTWQTSASINPMKQIIMCDAI